MSKTRVEWKVGLFVFVGLVLLGVLLLQFSKGTSIFRPTFSLRLHAGNVGGLKTRAAVLMSGVQVGTVADISLAPDGKSVTILLRIYNQYAIHKDARFLIEQSGFLGDQYVAISPTKNEGDVFKNGDEATAESPFNLQETARSAGGFIQRIDTTAQKLNEAIADIRRHVLNEQTLTNLSTAVGNMRLVSDRALTTVGNINTLLDTNGPAIGNSMSNLVYFSEQINEFATAFRGVLATNTVEINAAVKNIESSTVVLKNLMDDLRSGKGLAGNHHGRYRQTVTHS